MAIPVSMPMLGVTMEEGTIAKWLKAEGEMVQQDEPLLLVETDKATVEVPAPASGVLQRIVAQPGDTVAVNALIAEIGSDSPASSPAKEGSASGAGAAPPAPPAPPRPVSDSQGAPALPTPLPSRGDGAGGDKALAPAAARNGNAGGRQFISPRARLRARLLGVDLAAVPGSGPRGRVVEEDVLRAAGIVPPPAENLTTTAAVPERVLATPLARKLADEHGLDLAALHGSGPGGRVTQEDVQRAIDARAATPAPAIPASTAPTPRGAASSAPAALGPPPSVKPLSRLRRITAERMAASARTVARVTIHLEADLGEAARFRAQLAPEFARLGVARLPWDALIAKAAGLALAEHAALRAHWAEGEGLRHHTAAHVGVAVALEPEGLVVPVLRDADTRSLRELAADLLALAEKARAGRLLPDEMQGGIFTITNLGAYRVDGFTPIVNPPETAILGVGRIADKPAVVDGQLAVRTLCTLSLSFDHRVVDGAPAAAFLARLTELLEHPYALLGI